MVRSAVVVLGVLACLGGGVEQVRAQTGPLVRLELDCPVLDAAEVRRILEAELGTDLLAYDAAWVTVITLRCEESVARVKVEDPVTRKVVSRGLNLDAVPEGSRSRLVALATAELVVATWAELELIAVPSVEPTGTRPPQEAVAAALEVVRDEVADAATLAQRERARRVTERRKERKPYHRIVPLVSARTFVNHPGSLWGGGLRFGKEVRRVFSWSVDALLEAGTIGGSSGYYDLTTTTLGGHIGFSYRGPNGSARFGAGLRAGVVHATLDTTPANVDYPEVSGSELAPWGWPMLVTTLDLNLGQGLVLELGGETGYVLLPLSGVRGTDAALRGVWVNGQVGIGWAW